MKKFYAALSLMVILYCVKANAQYVTIPDPNFLNWLDTSGYSGCIVGNQLDTTCPEVVNAITVNCHLSFISDLTGIQYFDNLDTLECSENLLTFLPELPTGLISLNCGFNQLTSLPALPLTLQILICQVNQITALPTLPLGLDILYAGQNELTVLPDLPMTLTQMDCSNNQLTALPQLPASLGSFSCSNNQITTLPTLPPSLSHLGCGDNPLSALPVLPNTIIAINCNNNQLSYLPPLPESLFILNAASNFLTELPPLPNNPFAVFFVNDNPMLSCIPPLHEFTGSPMDFSIYNTAIQCLPNVIQHIGFIPQIDTMPICNPANPNGCEVAWNILGTVFTETDNDCTTEGDPKLKNVKLNLFKNGLLEEQFFSVATGMYSFQTDYDNYVVSVDTASLPFNVTCPAAHEYSFEITAEAPFDSTNNFALQCNAGLDLTVHSVNRTSGFFLPGQPATVTVQAGDAVQYYGALCNTSGVSGSVTALYDGPVTLSAVSGNGTTNGNEVTWAVSDFASVDFFNDFKLMFVTDTAAQTGEDICLTVTVTTGNATETNSNNNTSEHCFDVVNSYDPNVKEVYPTTWQQAGDWYTYTIHFQNTGNAPAFNIIIKDTLDANLNWTTFERLGASHNDLTQVKQGGIVHFNFPNINLPDSNSNEPASHGWVQYRIKSNSNTPPGTTIHNTAAIYFDFNDPVITNDALVEYSTSIASLDQISFQLFPNPAAESVTVTIPEALKNGLVEIMDITGRKIIDAKIENADPLVLTVDALQAGSYFVRLFTDGGVSAVRKLVVVK